MVGSADAVGKFCLKLSSWKDFGRSALPPPHLEQRGRTHYAGENLCVRQIVSIHLSKRFVPRISLTHRIRMGRRSGLLSSHDSRELAGRKSRTITKIDLVGVYLPSQTERAAVITYFRDKNGR
jgi:hypothetical protein